MDDKKTREKHLKDTHKVFLKAIRESVDQGDYNYLPERNDIFDIVKSGINRNKLFSIACAIDYILEHSETECHECGHKHN